jgi:hypothetical protein
VIRFDRGKFKSTIKPRLIEGVVARVHAVGDGLVYADGEQYRDLAELQNIVDQLPGLPVATYAEPDAVNPPSHPDGLLSEGTDYHEIGRVMGARVENDEAVATIYIHDKGALQAVEDGIKELSLGYRCTTDADHYQRGIELDHLSLVYKARCGAACSLRTDAVETARPCIAQIVPDASLLEMQVPDLTVGVKIVLDEESEKILATLQPKVVEEQACACKSHAMPHNNGESTMDAAQLQKNLDEALAKIAELETELTSFKTAKADEAAALALDQATANLRAETLRAEKLAGEIETVRAEAQAQVDAAKAARTDAEVAEFNAAVDARIELLADATTVGIEDVKSKTDREIKVAIVNKVDGRALEDTRSADYVNAMYDGAMGRFSKAAASVAEVRTALVETHDAAVVVADPYKKESEISAAAEAKRRNRWR